MDWSSFQANHREEWLALLRKTFASLDSDKDGVLRAEDMIRRVAAGGGSSTFVPCAYLHFFKGLVVAISSYLGIMCVM